MNKFLLTIVSILTIGTCAYAQVAPGQMNFTIKGGPSNTQVQIYAKPLQDFTGKWGQIEVVYGYQTSCFSSAPTMTWTTNPALNTLFGASYGVVTNNAVTSTNPTGYTVNVTSLQLGVGSTNNTVLANTEVLLGTVTLSSNPTTCPVGLFDFWDGGSSTTANTFITIGATGDYWTPTYGNSGFYGASSGSGLFGSTASTTGSVAGGNLNSFDWVTFATPLPVKLESFDASVNHCRVLLSWKTGNERDFDHFDIESGTDGRSFAKLGSIKSLNNPAGGNYTYTAEGASGIRYYRLVMVDKDGSYTVSNTLTVHTDCGLNGYTAWSIYPNPSGLHDDLYIKLNASTDIKKATVTVSDMLGRKVWQKVYEVNEGENIYTMPAADWPRGTYMVTMTDDRGMPVGSAQKSVIQ